MKTQFDLVELAKEVTRQAAVKDDFLVNTKQLQVTTEAKLHIGDIESGEQYPMTDNAHRQLSTWAGIPSRYYEKLREENPVLLAENANYWLNKSDDRRMVRTLDGTARAFLSNRFLRLDNDQVMETVLHALQDMGQVEYSSNGMTSNKLWMKTTFPQLEGEVKKGDIVRSGIMTGNSETGQGSFFITPFIERLICLNGMVAKTDMEFGFSRHHIGKQLQDVLSGEALRADNRAIMLQIRDVIKAAADPAVFNVILERMRTAAQSENIVKPVEAIEKLSKNYLFSENEQNRILENLIKDQDYTKWGALNAVTKVANNTESYERATELETIGGQMLDLPESAWHQIAA